MLCAQSSGDDHRHCGRLRRRGQSQMLRFKLRTGPQKRFTRPPVPRRVITPWQRCRQARTTSRSLLQDSTRTTSKTCPSAQQNRCAWMFACSNTSWALLATGGNSEFSSPVRIRRHPDQRREPPTANPTSPASGTRKEQWIRASRSLCLGRKRCSANEPQTMQRTLPERIACREASPTRALCFLSNWFKRPTLLVMLFEDDIPSHRQVFLDGRSHPKDPNPMWMGHSIGHWEGDTLVIDTRGLRRQILAR